MRFSRSWFDFFIRVLGLICLLAAANRAGYSNIGGTGTGDRRYGPPVSGPRRRSEATRPRHVTSRELIRPGAGVTSAGRSLTSTHASSKALGDPINGTDRSERIGMDDATAALLAGAGGPTPTALWRARADGARHDGAVGPHLQAARGAAAGTRDPHGAHPQGPAAAAIRAPTCMCVSLLIDLFLLRPVVWFPAAPQICAAPSLLCPCWSHCSGVSCF
jgi:hypothetical protein